MFYVNEQQLINFKQFNINKTKSFILLNCFYQNSSIEYSNDKKIIFSYDKKIIFSEYCDFISIKNNQLICIKYY